MDSTGWKQMIRGMLLNNMLAESSRCVDLKIGYSFKLVEILKWIILIKVTESITLSVTFLVAYLVT